GLAFHPDFKTNGLFYVNYTARKEKKQLRTFVSEFHADPKARTADRSTERVVLTVDQPYPNHNGGDVVFGPDGMLYIGFGDGGSAGDPQNRAQNPQEILGKIIRIDVNGRGAAGGEYAIPKDNPFVNDSSYRPEIWT